MSHRLYGKLWLFAIGLMLGAAVQFVEAEGAPGLDDLVSGGAAELIATGFQSADGPVWHPDGYLLFSDVEANVIYKWVPIGIVTEFRMPSGDSRGLTLDRQGRLIACEQRNRRISRTEADGSVVTLVDRYKGKKLNSPNDVIVRSDGRVYFTDLPNWRGSRELPFAGVYGLSSDAKTLELLTDNRSPNSAAFSGLAFSPDEATLYVTVDSNGQVLAFDVRADGSLGQGRLLALVYSACCGIKVDVNGNLYVATNTPKISVFNATGSQRGYIEVPEAATNCAFGGLDNETLFITAGTSVYRIQMKVPGMPVGLDKSTGPTQ